jgi:phosphatidylserine/phosphatidylglycerophosphate/cardiolipin synthase-like enzyme
MKKQKLPWPYFRLPTSFLLLLLVLYTITVYFLSQEKTVSLPEQAVPIRLYSNQAHDDLKRTYTQAILGAKECIYLSIYSLTDDGIISALKQRAEDGVKVLIVADAVATQDAQSKLGDKVELVQRRQKGLMHNKLLAIDHEMSWIGSANLTRDSLTLHANIVIGIASPSIAKAIEDKTISLATKGRKIEPLMISTPQQSLELCFLQDDPKALHKVLTQLRGAQKSIKVAMFTFTHPALIDALIEAHKRGIDVDVVIDNDSARKTSSLAYKRFVHEKVPVAISRRAGLLHEKMAIIDDKTLIMGSANWTRAAFTQNSENIVILQDLTPEQQSKLATFWQTTKHESS